MEAYRLYINGDDSGPLCEILPDTSDNRMWAEKHMLQAHEFFEENAKMRDGDVIVEYKTRLLEYYDAFFGKTLPTDKNDRMYAHVAYELNSIRATMYQVLTLLSPVCDYTFK